MFLQLQGDNPKAKPARILNTMSLNELKDFASTRLGVNGTIIELKVCGPVEWVIECDDDVTELAENDVISILLESKE